MTDSELVHEYAAGFIQFVKDGYFFVRMKNNSVSTIESVEESHDIMTSILPEGPVYILVDAGTGATAENDIYEYIAGSEFGNRVKAEAVIVHDLAARLMGNLFFRVIKNKRHIKIFSNQEDAELWLRARMDDVNQNKKKSKKLMFV